MTAHRDADSSARALRACTRCRAGLRRGNPAERCDPCSHHSDIARRLWEAGFFTQDSVRRALASYEFGRLFRAVRRTTELTQSELGALLDLDQDRISRIERGQRPLRDIAAIARIASRLGIPPLLLGFDAKATTVDKTPTSNSEQEVDWVRRRNFSWAAAGTLLGLSIAGLDFERLTALLSGSPAQTPVRIGAADVVAIEQATGTLRSLGFSSGSGLRRCAAAAQLQSVLPLQDAVCTADVRERLRIATADLGLVAGWANYDAERHNDARHLWLIALNFARQAEHPRAADLTAHLLMCMTDQALNLRQPEEASNLIQLAYHSATRRNESLPASTASYLALHQAWSHAALGDVRSCDYACGQAIEHFSRIDPAAAPPWAAHITAVALAAHQGAAYYTLAQATADPQYAAQAVLRLQEAVDGYGPAYARSRALALCGLAGAQALAGDLNAGARSGHQAIQEITALSSPRVYARLRTLDAVLAPHIKDSDIGAVREEIRIALSAA